MIGFINTSDSFSLAAIQAIQEDADFSYITSIPMNDILSLHTGETDSVVLDYTGATSYDAVTDLPSYITQSTTTVTNDTITATTPSVAEHNLLNVTVNTASGSDSVKVRASVFPLETNLQTIIDGMTAQTATEKITTLGTALHTDPQYCYNPDGTTWTAMFCYYRGYGTSQQVITVDLSDGLVKSNNTTDFASESWHNFKTVPSSIATKTYLNPPASGDRIAIHIYDTSTHTWDVNVVGYRDDHMAGAQRSRVTQGTNGRIYSFGVTGSNSEHSILEIDPSNSNAVRYWTNLTGDDTGGTQSVAADDEYVYYKSDPYNNTQIRYVRLSDGATGIVSNLAATSQSLVQHKLGVTLGTVGYIYQGAYTASDGDINGGNIPWNGGVDTTDLSIETYAQDTPLALGATDTTAMTPIDGTIGYLNYKTLATDPTWTKVNITGITTYSPLLRKVGVLSDNNILCEAETYSGYSIYNTTADSIAQYIPVSDPISNYSLVMDNDNSKAYISGYFNSPILDYDQTQLWDNAISASYNPDTDYSDTNPLSSTGHGSLSNVSKAFNGCVGANNLIYFAGEKVRSGDGGGVVIYQPLDPSNVDLYINTGLAGHNPRDVVATKDFIVTASYPEAGQVPLQDKLTVYSYPNTYEREIYPDANISTDAIRLTSNGLNDNYVYFLSEDDTTGFVRLFKHDVSDGSEVWQQTYEFTAEIGGYNDNNSTRLMLASDGFLYMTFSNFVVMRIDPENGNIEPAIKYSGSSMHWFDAKDNELYFAGSSVLQSLTGFKVIYS